MIGKRNTDSSTSRPQFHWRILPAFVLIGMSCFVGVLFYNNVVIHAVPLTHPAHFLIFVAGLAWFAGAIFVFRGNWIVACLAAIVGVALPFFRSLP